MNDRRAHLKYVECNENECDRHQQQLTNLIKFVIKNIFQMISIRETEGVSCPNILLNVTFKIIKNISLSLSNFVLSLSQLIAHFFSRSATNKIEWFERKKSQLSIKVS